MEVLVLWEYEGWEVRILSSVNRIINSVYVVKMFFDLSLESVYVICL